VDPEAREFTKCADKKSAKKIAVHWKKKNQETQEGGATLQKKKGPNPKSQKQQELISHARKGGSENRRYNNTL